MNTGRPTSVTFLFADPGDSLQLWEQHPAAMQAALPAFRAALQQAVAAQHGEVFNFSNDTLQAAFQAATDAVNAALQAQRALLSITGDLPLRPRLALLTGSAQRQGDEFLGPAPHRAARLLSLAHGGQVLLCRITADLARSSLPPGATLLDLGEHRLPDLTHPERLYQLAAPGLPEAFPPLKSLNNQATNLPIQPNPLIGRQPELLALTQLLRSDEVRLLTLTGTGGTGKTRLALQAAAGLFAAFPDGVFFAPLDQVADPALVAFAVAQALSLEQSGHQSIENLLQTHLRERRTLLVLDNFEHLLPAASLVSGLLAACPQLKILVTSREALRLRSEREFPVSPLPVPDSLHPTPPDQLAQFASVALFIQRAQAARPDFAVDSATAPAVAEICAFLDGLPLAIELAAAQVRMFSPQALLARLKAQPNLKLFSAGPRDQPARQQTLQNTLAWSYNLLNAGEQALYRRLGVFAGGFTPEAAAAVCYPGGEQPEDIYAGLTSLLEKSMIRRSENGAEQTRLSMLFILRQFALELLEQAGELPAYRQAHAAHYLAIAEQVRPDQPEKIFSESEVSPEAIARLVVEQENLREALRWSLSSSDSELALRLVNALDIYWFYQSNFQERYLWEDAVIHKTAGETNLRRGKALRNLIMTIMMINRGADKRITSLLEEAMSLYQKLGDESGIGAVFSDQALYEMAVTGNLEKGAVLFKESVLLSRKLDSKVILIRDLTNLAWVLFLEGKIEEALPYLQECQLLCQKTGDRYGLAMNYDIFGWINQQQGKLGEALEHVTQSTHIFRSLGMFRYELVNTMLNLSGIASRMGDGRSAAEFFGAAQKLIDTLGMQLPADTSILCQRVREQASSVAGEADWDSGYAAGLKLELESASDWAMERITDLQMRLKMTAEIPETAKQKNIRTAYPAGLTAREVEILRLLVQGLADAQIAESLFISPRTVNAHITSIYSKLGVNSRAAATRFAIAHHLA